MANDIKIPINKEFPFSIGNTNLIPLYIGSKTIPFDVYDALSYIYETWYFDNKYNEYKVNLVRNRINHLNESANSTSISKPLNEKIYTPFFVEIRDVEIYDPQFDNPIAYLQNSVNSNPIYKIPQLYIPIFIFNNIEVTVTYPEYFNPGQRTQLDQIIDKAFNTTYEKLYIKGNNKISPIVKLSWGDIQKTIYRVPHINKILRSTKRGTYAVAGKLVGPALLHKLVVPAEKSIKYELERFLDELSNTLLSYSKAFGSFPFTFTLQTIGEMDITDVFKMDFLSTTRTIKNFVDYLYIGKNLKNLDKLDNYTYYPYTQAEVPHLQLIGARISSSVKNLPAPVESPQSKDSNKNTTNTNTNTSLGSLNFKIESNVDTASFLDSKNNYQTIVPKLYNIFIDRQKDIITQLLDEAFLLFVRQNYPKLYKILINKTPTPIDDYRQYISEYKLSDRGNIDKNKIRKEFNKWLSNKNNNSTINDLYKNLCMNNPRIIFIRAELNKSNLRESNLVSVTDTEKLSKLQPSLFKVMNTNNYVVGFDSINNLKCIDVDYVEVGDSNKLVSAELDLVYDIYVDYGIDLNTFLQINNIVQQEEEYDKGKKDIDTMAKDATKGLNSIASGTGAIVGGDWKKLQPLIRLVNPHEVIDYVQLNKIYARADYNEAIKVRTSLQSFITNFGEGLPIVVKTIPIRAKESDEEIAKMIISALDKNEHSPLLITFAKEFGKKVKRTFMKFGKALLKFALTVLTLSLYKLYLKKYSSKVWNSSIKEAILENDSEHKPAIVLSIDQFDNPDWELDINRLNLFFRYGWGNVFIIDDYNERLICIMRVGFGTGKTDGYITVIPYQSLPRVSKSRYDKDMFKLMKDKFDNITNIGKTYSLKDVTKLVQDSLNKRG